MQKPSFTRRNHRNFRWPERIYIVRHGQSAGNVARETAEAADSFTIEMPVRDVDIPLSALGERQARAIGKWMSELPREEQPTVVLASPYERAKHTGELILEQLGLEESKLNIVYDERLREREFGTIEGFTRKGIIDRFPLEAESYDRLGKFYYRPPGGESWADVILRLRSFIDSLAIEYEGERVMIVCHTVVVMCFRYLFEHLTEKELLKIDRENLLANCSLTSYRFDAESKVGNNLSLDRFNFVVPLEEAGAKVTRAQDAPKN